MKFLPLFRVQVHHDYYGDALCRDLLIEPTADTRLLLERHRLLLREQPNGIAVWATTGADTNTALIPLQGNEVFTFKLIVRNPDFTLFTDLQEFAGKTDPVYHNADMKDTTLKLYDRESRETETVDMPAGSSKIRFTLAGNPLAQNGDVHKVPQPADFNLAAPGTAIITDYDAPARTVTIESSMKSDARVTLGYRVLPARDKQILAALELRYDPSVVAESDTVHEAVSFELGFRARHGRWAYYLITDQKKVVSSEQGSFSIVDSDKVLAFSPTEINHDEINQSGINASGDEDLMAATLSRKYPALRQVRFLSDEPVPYSSAARTGIELWLDKEKVFETMPNPSIQHLSQIRKKVQAELNDQDTLYQVVKHLKAQ